jgi:hypothetical protein
MICKHITKRSYQLKPYIWCRKLKKVITWDDCKNCVEIEPRENKPIKKKSNKLAKLERNRFSILTEDLDHCYICKTMKLKEVPKDDLHEIFPGRNRQICMRYGFVAPLCRQCHEDKKAKEYLKQLCMAKAKDKYSEEELKEILK